MQKRVQKECGYFVRWKRCGIVDVISYTIGQGRIIVTRTVEECIAEVTCTVGRKGYRKFAWCMV